MQKHSHRSQPSCVRTATIVKVLKRTPGLATERRGQGDAPVAAVGTRISLANDAAQGVDSVEAEAPVFGRSRAASNISTSRTTTAVVVLGPLQQVDRRLPPDGRRKLDRRVHVDRKPRHRRGIRRRRGRRRRTRTMSTPPLPLPLPLPLRSAELRRCLAQGHGTQRAPLPPGRMDEAGEGAHGGVREEKAAPT